ncbi:MAG TPA: tRNA (adenosine(37)-N6)-threonylcarbamoyltransferase complex dimerization subunit type 1 TsaB [Dehalococcoidia bacterium]|nr:tRNA (adenosine(37)-N6)-threonylcarbamoyltransferase complex dimerization subunit type 1 TsaB [Dehalococcoidia bacterium]
MVEVAIDSASDVAGVALTSEGELVSELTWKSRQNQSRELLPALDWLLKRGNFGRQDITAISVCIGPGSYAGLRVGLSAAKALAYGLGARLAGVGRLAADALPFAIEEGRRVIAVHAAGRAELAFAAYARHEGRLTEVFPPRLARLEQLALEVKSGDIVCGALDEGAVRTLRESGAAWAEPHPARVLAVAALGWQRLRSGDIDSAESLVPLYLREPAIGPQPSAR